ncbi:DUF1795 domain-containing protein [Yokenella regensburgei]|uniref:DcrB-related protein n=1 Tax=Yokenella regensburgei TaxID=158877 RepID=UPI003F1734CF
MMNVLRQSHDGSGGFTFVVSRTRAEPDDKVHDIAARTLRELNETLTDFYLESTQMLTVDSYPAFELFYQFRNDNHIIFQRQTLILIDSPNGEKKLVSYVATCMDEFSLHHQQQYQDTIQGIKFHRGK